MKYMVIKSDIQIFVKAKEAKKGALFFPGKVAIFDKFVETAQKAESLTINSVGQRPMKRDTHVIPKPQRGVIDLINRITPFQGLPFRIDLFRRALPYAIDLWAFSPTSNRKSSVNKSIIK
jgi:hypothetical protein